MNRKKLLFIWIYFFIANAVGLRAEVLQSSSPAVIEPGTAAEIEIRTSEQLTGSPSLDILLPNGTISSIELSLSTSPLPSPQSGEGEIWIGNLQVSSAMPSGTATFSYSGTSAFTGNTSTAIVSGKELIVGTFPQTLLPCEYEITLFSSKKLLFPPLISYVLPGQSTVSVSAVNVSGDQTRWSFPLLIPSTCSSGAGNFYWNGVDLSGSTGTAISIGCSFIINAAPSIDSISQVIEASYLRDGFGGKFVSVSGDAIPGSSVTVIVRTNGQIYDQLSVLAGSDGRWSAQVGLFGGQSQIFEISAFGQAGSETIPESAVQQTSLLLNVTAPVVSAMTTPISAPYLRTGFGGGFIELSGTGVPGSSVTIVVRTDGQRFDQSAVMVSTDGQWKSSAGIFGKQSQSFDITAFSQIGGDFSAESSSQTTTLVLFVSSPTVDSISQVIEAPYINAGFGGKFVSVSGSAVPGSSVTVIVRTEEARYDQPSVVASTEGRWSADIGIFGNQSQIFEINAFAQIDNDSGMESGIQVSTLTLYVPAPYMNSIASVVESTYSGSGFGGKFVVVTGTGIPGSEIIPVVRTNEQQYDQTGVVVSTDGTWTGQVSIFGSNGQIFEVNSFAKVGDDYSAKSSVQNVSLKLIDTTPPVISITSPLNGAVVSKTISIAGSALDDISLSQVELQIDGGSFSPVSGVDSWSYSLNTLTLSNGNHTITARAVDSGGNSQSAFITIIVDNASPLISGVSASNLGSYSATINWLTDETGDSQVEYGLTGSYGNITTLNSALSTLHTQPISGLSAETVYHYRVKSQDALGNSTTSGDFTFTTLPPPDTTPPTVAMISPVNGAILATGVPAISVQYSDAGSGMKEVRTEVVSDEGDKIVNIMLPTSLTSFTTSFTLTDGNYTITISAADHAGNNSVITSSFTVDTVPPTASITISPSSPLKIGIVTVTLTSLELLPSAPALTLTTFGNEIIPVSLSDSDGNKVHWAGSFEISSNTADGTATFSWSGTDLAGNTGTQITTGATFFVDLSAPIGTLSINNGAEITKSGDVVLTLSVEDLFGGYSSSDSIKMAFSNDGVNFTEPELFFEAKQWQLEPVVSGKVISEIRRVYVKFMDGVGNESVENDSILSDTSQDPSAKIEILRSAQDDKILQSSGPVVVEPGVHTQIEVVTSQETNSAPSLNLFLPDGTTLPITLSLSNSPSPSPSPLDGEGKVWMGSLAIPSTMSLGVGTFNYSAVGISGNTSSDILSGKTLVIGKFPQVVTSGNYEMVLVTSKELESAPTTFVLLPGETSAGTITAVNPSGDKTIWHSSVEITTGAQEGAASVSMTGKDFVGNTASEISFGNSFIVDFPPVMEIFISSGGIPALNGVEVTLTVNSNKTLPNAPTVRVAQNGQTEPAYILTSSTDNKNWTGNYTAVENYDGMAVVTATGADIFGLVGVAENSFVVDTTSPMVHVDSVTPPIFSPDGNGIAGDKIYDTADLNYTLSDNISSFLNLSITIFNSSGNIVRSLLSGAQRSTGTNVELWDGVNNSGMVVPEGNYRIEMEAFDEAGNQFKTTSAVTVNYPPALSVSAIPFTAKTNDTVTVTVYSNKTLANIPSITMVDSSSVTVQFSSPSVSGNRTVCAVVVTSAMAEGLVAITVSGTDTLGFTKTSTGSFSINNLPDLGNLSNAPDPFSPNNDFVNDISAVSYELTANALITIKIPDSNGTVVRNLVTSIAEPAGIHSHSWDGRDDHGGSLPNGNYSYEITSNVGGSVTKLTTSVTIQNPLLTVTGPGFYVDGVVNNIFSPDGNGVGDTISIQYTLSEGATVSVNILSPDKTTVIKHLTANVFRPAGTSAEVWDGVQDNGFIAPNDQYFVQIIGTTFGNMVQTNPSPIKAQSQDILVLSNIIATPDPFSPDRDGLNDSTAISYTLSDLKGSTSAWVSINIYSDKNGTQLVKKLVNNSLEPIDLSVKSHLWDGTNESGLVVVSGDYYYEITGTDSFGYTTKIGPGIQQKISVNANVLTISGGNSDPASFSPDGDGTDDFTAISYTLNDSLSAAPATVNVNIFSDASGTQMIRHLVKGTTVTTGVSQSHVWDGRNDSGQRVSPMNCYYQISAADPLGFSAVTPLDAQHKITVGGIYIYDISSTPDPFSPDGDGTKDTTDIDFSVSKAASVNIDIVNPVNAAFNRSIDLGNVPAGSITVSWDGKDGGGNSVDDGIYRYTIDARSGQNNAPQETGYSIVSKVAGNMISSGAAQFIYPWIYQPVSLVQRSTPTSAEQRAILSSGLDLISPVYEIEPEGTAFYPSAIFVISYDQNSLPAGVVESSLQMYHFAGTEWTPLNGIVDTLNNRIIVQIENISSIFAILAKPDFAPPSTEMKITGNQHIYPDGNLYISSDSAISFEAVDPFVDGSASGVAFTEYSIDGGIWNAFNGSFVLPSGNHIISYHSRDNAGNLEFVKSVTVIVDAVAPVVTIYSPAGGEKFVAGRDTIRIDFTVADNYDSAPSSTAFLTPYFPLNNKGDEKGFFKGGVEGVLSVMNGEEIEPLSLSAGYWRLTVSATDFAGNSVSSTTALFEVVHDTIPPQSQLRVEGLEFRNENGRVFISPGSRIEIFSTDDLLVKGDKSGVGVKEIKFRVDSLEFREVVSSSLTTSFTLTEGIHTIQFYAVDHIGNIESIQSKTLYVDGTPPVTTISVSSPSFNAFGETFISIKTPLTLSATDSLSVGVAVGVQKIEFRVTGAVPTGVYSSFTPYHSPFTIAEITGSSVSAGSFTIEYRAIDNLSNTETVRTKTVIVSPVSDFSLTGVNGLNIGGQSSVTGNVGSNGTVVLNGKSVVTGSVSGETITLVGKSIVTGEMTSNAAKISSVAIDLGTITANAVQNNNNSVIPKTNKGKTVLDDNLVFKLSGKDSITLSAGVYYFTKIEISAQSALNISGKVSIVCSGEILISGKSEVNKEGDSGNLIIFASSPIIAGGISASTIAITGQSLLTAILYAPLSKISIDGQSQGIGNFFGSQVQISGQSVVGKDKTVPSVNSGSFAAPQLSASSVSSSPNVPLEAFVLGEVYAFPNPAVREKTPTIHLECGVADSVEIRIYDTAGELVHEISLDQLPTAGIWNSEFGLRYAYEYQWNTSGVPSGVYVYVITAKKSGEPDIRVMKKLALVK